MNRIFITYQIHLGNIIEILDQTNYLINVLRLSIKSKILIFNGIDGEYIAEIQEIKKKSILINIIKKVREQFFLEELNIYLANIKPEKMFLAIDLAIQLGATSITPIITEYVQYKQVNYDKINKRIIESIEQSNRLDKPTLNQSINFISLIQQKEKMIIWANEREIQTNINDLDIKLFHSILIGPEGGFSEREKNLMLENQNFKSVSLGKTILRTETALACAISQMNLLKNK
jgi:16S rRNA (uracil1498-N3)-methyltransferase